LKLLKKLLFSIFLIILTGLSIVGITHKADELNKPQSVISLGLNPSIIELVLEKTGGTESQVQISNLTNLPIPIKLSKQSFTPKEKIEINTEDIKRFDASSWIEIDDDYTDFILQPKEFKDIKFKISPPDNAAPGGHYATLIFEPLIPQGLISDKSVFIYSRVAALVFMQVRGDIKEELKIQSFNTEAINNQSNITFDLTLANSGNTHLRPKYQIKVTNFFNGNVEDEVNIADGIVLPNTSRTFSRFVNLNTLFGVYSAEATVNYGRDEVSLSDSKVYFIIVPYQWIVLIIIILIITYLLLFKGKSRVLKALEILRKG